MADDRLPLDWLFDWAARPRNPWAYRIGFLLSFCFGVLDLITGAPLWMITAIGLWWWSNTNWIRTMQERSKARSAAWRAQMAEFEQLIAAAHRIGRIERLITPDWML